MGHSKMVERQNICCNDTQHSLRGFVLKKRKAGCLRIVSHWTSPHRFSIHWLFYVEELSVLNNPRQRPSLVAEI